MIKNGLFCILGFFWGSTNALAGIPELVDLNLVGPKEAAHFEPEQLELMEGESYLFVINNPFEVPYNFKAPTFASAIVTQYIQGSPSVTQSSVQIAPNSKVQWVFRVTKAGQHEFSASTQGIMSHKLKPGIITLLGLHPEQSKVDVKGSPGIEVKLPNPQYIASLEASDPALLGYKKTPQKKAKKPKWGGKPD